MFSCALQQGAQIHLQAAFYMIFDEFLDAYQGPDVSERRHIRTR
jgi:hypothetical protein